MKVFDKSYLCRKTPVKGILKSRPVTPDVQASVGEKSKVLADKALNILNPLR